MKFTRGIDKLPIKTVTDLSEQSEKQHSNEDSGDNETDLRGMQEIPLIPIEKVIKIEVQDQAYYNELDLQIERYYLLE